MEKRSYEVTCPHCRAPLTYESRNLIGSKETCPHCQTVFHITEPVNESPVTVFSEDTDTEEYSKTTNLSDEEFHLLGIPVFLLIIVLFLFVSIPMMEKHNLERRTDYAQYQARTSRLLILPSKK